MRAREQTFLENVHPPLCVRCQVSCVMCHVSGVTCQGSQVTFFNRQSDAASWWRVRYQRGVSRLFFFIFCQILGRLSAYKNIYVPSVTDHIMIKVPEIFIF